MKKCTHKHGLVHMQLAWNHAYYCVKCGVLRGKSISLRDEKEAELFAKEDQRQRHDTNREVALAAR